MCHPRQVRLGARLCGSSPYVVAGLGVHPVSAGSTASDDGKVLSEISGSRTRGVGSLSRKQGSDVPRETGEFDLQGSA